MSRRRKKAEPDLPLFDLPLFDESGSGTESAEAAADAAAVPNPPAGRPEPAPPVPPVPAATAAPKVAPSPAPTTLPASAAAEPGLLFTEDDLVPVGPAASRAAESSSTDEEGEAQLPDGASDAPVQDRWLGGLADLTLHLATLGAMVLAVQLMGVPVTLADLPAFALLGLVFSLLYTVVPLAFWGQTPGMAWVGHLARGYGGEPLSFGQTFLRWLGALITVALVGLPVLLAFSGRSLCDRLSDSRTHQL